MHIDKSLTLDYLQDIAIDLSIEFCLLICQYTCTVLVSVWGSVWHVLCMHVYASYPCVFLGWVLLCCINSIYKDGWNLDSQHISAREGSELAAVWCTVWLGICVCDVWIVYFILRLKNLRNIAYEIPFFLISVAILWFWFWFWYWCGFSCTYGLLRALFLSSLVSLKKRQLLNLLNWPLAKPRPP